MRITTRDSSPVPFAPLTHEELNRRSAETREAIGHHVCSAVRQDGAIQPHDLPYLETLGRQARAYLDAALVRCGEPVTA